jgi:hypothetical protein
MSRYLVMSQRLLRIQCLEPYKKTKTVIPIRISHLQLNYLAAVQNSKAGLMTPAQVPNPTNSNGVEPQTPEKMTSSPSWRNCLLSLPTWISTFPPLVCSNRLPKEPCSLPLIVPLPSRSPVLNGQPPTVW